MYIILNYIKLYIMCILNDHFSLSMMMVLGATIYIDVNDETYEILYQFHQVEVSWCTLKICSNKKTTKQPKAPALVQLAALWVSSRGQPQPWKQRRYYLEGTVYEGIRIMLAPS